MVQEEKKAGQTLHRTKAKVHGKSTRIMIDSGAEANMMSPGQAQRLGIRTKPKEQIIRCEAIEGSPLFTIEQETGPIRMRMQQQ